MKDTIELAEKGQQMNSESMNAYEKEIYPLILKAYEIAVKHDMQMIWLTAMDKKEDTFVITSSIRVQGSSAPGFFHDILDLVAENTPDILSKKDKVKKVVN